MGRRHPANDAAGMRNGDRVRIDGHPGTAADALHGARGRVLGVNANYNAPDGEPMTNIGTDDGRVVAVPTRSLRRESE